MFKWLFHILIFATNDGSGKYQNKEKPLKRQRKLGLDFGVVRSWLSYPTVMKIVTDEMPKVQNSSLDQAQKIL